MGGDLMGRMSVWFWLLVWILLLVALFLAAT